MQYIILLQPIVLFIIFLFALSKDNFVLLRKNISTDKVFNIAFLVGLVGLLFARIFYVIFHFQPGFFQPLVFFVFPYFPGFSAGGGALAGFIFFMYYTNKNKLLPSYLLDIFSIAFLSTIPFGILIAMLLTKHFFPFSIPFIVGLAIELGFLIYLFHKNKLQDGSIGYISLISIAISLYCFDLIQKIWFRSEDIVFLALFIIGIFFISKQEGLIDKIRPKKKKKRPQQRFRILSFD